MFTKNDSEMEITAEEFPVIINNSHKLVVVNFFAEWNMHCLMLDPIIEEFAEKMKNIQFVKINLDENQELVDKCDVSKVPCLIIYKDGKETERIIGNQDPEVIEEKINRCLD